MNDIHRVECLIAKGGEVLATHRPNPPSVHRSPTLDSGAFAAWQTQCLSFLESRLPQNGPYTREFCSKVKEGYRGSVEAGIAILQSVREDMLLGAMTSGPNAGAAPMEAIRNICDRFHLVARQLRSRRQNRSTLDVGDEYDMQDLIHSLLHLYFDDIRPEEWTPSYAGACSRMDFLLKNERVVMELKHTRQGLQGKQLGAQLIEDIERYSHHPECMVLVCFVYDPNGWIDNPRGIENDLSRDNNPLRVHVLIRP